MHFINLSKIKLIKEPHPLLHQKASKVKDLKDPKIIKIIEKMSKIMQKNKGIGLAAPQVGLLARIILIQTENGILPLINPQITKKSKKKVSALEGCLSVPGVSGMVLRNQSIKVQALSMGRDHLLFKAEGLFARVIQHEVDHLNGILFTEKMENPT